MASPLDLLREVAALHRADPSRKWPDHIPAKGKHRTLFAPVELLERIDAAIAPQPESDRGTVMTAPPEPTLPPLPKPFVPGDDANPRDFYSAEQMREYARAALAAPPKPLDDPRLQQLFAWTIDGALTSGYQGVAPAPAGHWLEPWWQKGREIAERESLAAPPNQEWLDKAMELAWNMRYSNSIKAAAEAILSHLKTAQAAPIVEPDHVEIAAAMIDGQRFFIDHDTIHDRLTGRHVHGNREFPPGEADEAVAMLNALARKAAGREAAQAAPIVEPAGSAQAPQQPQAGIAEEEYCRYGLCRPGGRHAKDCKRSGLQAAPQDELDDAIADAMVDANLSPKFCIEYAATLQAFGRAVWARATPPLQPAAQTPGAQGLTADAEDAARWRFVRDANPDDGLPHVITYEQNDWGNWRDVWHAGEEADAVVDAAMKGGTSEQAE